MSRRPPACRRPTTNPTPKHSAHHPVVVSKHESCADEISKGADLLLPKHELQEVGFPWKFPEISGNFRRSAVSRRSAVGGRLRCSAVGLPPPEVKFPWKFPETWFLSRGQISKRISRNLCQGQTESPGYGSPPFGSQGPCAGEGSPRRGAAAVLASH